MSGKSSQLIRWLEQRDCRPVVVASHPRSGTHLCIDTLRLNYRQCACSKRILGRADRVYVDLDAVAKENHVHDSVIGRVLSRADRPLIKTHALPSLTGFCTWSDDPRLDPELAQWVRRNAMMVYVYRDGRETLYSFHQFMASYASEARVSLSRFLRQRVHGVSRVKAWALHVARWLREPNVRVLTMEHLLRSPIATVPALARSLGLGPVEREIRRPRKAGVGLLSRLRQRMAIRPASTAILMPHAAGNRWRQAYSRADRDFFHQEAGQLLIDLGYEDSDAWVDDPEHGREQFNPPVRL